MVSPRRVDEAAASPASSGVYFMARSRTASVESAASAASAGRRLVALAPLSGDGRAISVSRNAKRQFKDRRIYVDQRTGLPVRPPTSFGLFKHALRRNMAGAKVSFGDFNKRATEQWARLREPEKEVYKQRARELGDQYKKIEVRFLRKKVRQMLDQRRARSVGGSSGSSGGIGGSGSSGKRLQQR